MLTQVVMPAGEGEKHDEPDDNVLSTGEGTPSATRQNRPGASD